MKAALTAPQATVISACLTLFGIVVTKLMENWLDEQKQKRAAK